MSSPANNNLPITPITPGPGTLCLRQQQRQSHEQSGSTLAQRNNRSHPVRGGRSSSNKRSSVGSNLAQKIYSDSPVQSSDGDSRCNDLNQSGSSQMTTSQKGTTKSDGSNIDPVSKSKSKNQKFAKGGNNGGKYRQRQQLNQLIDNMEGLNIDLVESIAPSGSRGRQKMSYATVGRKVNLTHLLNSDRSNRSGRYHSHQNRASRGYERSGNQSRTYFRDSSSFHKFSKQQFLQANCQFVVLPSYDYSIHKFDPDWPIEWDCIEEVQFRQTGTTGTTCPICLDLPVAAKITRCGHIYCWTCMLHYLSLSDEKSRQCPICFEFISEDDLRSVVPKLYSNYAVEEEITMRLMFRRKGCVDVKPFNMDEHLEAQTSIANSEANLLIMDPETVIKDILKREQDELNLKFELDRGEPELCFVEQAIEKLKCRIERLQKIPSDSIRVIKSHQGCNQPSDSRTDKSFLFYQSSDGQHVYLDPFSTKILCHEYGSLENCPILINAKILQMNWISMSDSWRKRFKYLEHLPLTCEFRLIEIDFKNSDLVSKETFEAYEDQIKVRANERAFRKTEEMKRDAIIQVEQNRKIYGIQPSLEINLDNEEQFPSVIDDRYFHLKTKSGISDSDKTQTAQVSETSADISAAGFFNLNSQQDNGVRLSFREIQDRQAAAVASIPAQRENQSVWPGGQSHSSRGTQSSFAKLLVDAKNNQKEWTRNISSSSSRTNVVSSASVSDQHSAHVQSALSLDADEEIRAPPCTFTISDFMDARRGKRPSKKSQ